MEKNKAALRKIVQDSFKTTRSEYSWNSFTRRHFSKQDLLQAAENFSYKKDSQND